MQYALIDDDIGYHLIFKQMVSRYIDENEVISFYTAESFLSALKENNNYFNVIFLDIDMPDMDGLTLYNEISNYDLSDAVIIYITNKRELAQKAYGINVLSFVCKSDLSERIEEIFDKINTQCSSLRYVELPIARSYLMVRIKDIVSCELVKRNFVVVNVKSEEYKTTLLKLNDFMLLINNSNFIYVNRSTIINLAQIKVFNNKYVIMTNDKKYDISRPRQKEVKEQFINFKSKL